MCYNTHRAAGVWYTPSGSNHNVNLSRRLNIMADQYLTIEHLTTKEIYTEQRRIKERERHRLKKRAKESTPPSDVDQ